MTAATEPDLSWLGPTVTAIGAVIVGLLGMLGLIWRRRQDRQDKKLDNADAKKLTEKDEYDEVRLARAEATRYYNLYVFFRGLFFDVQQALRHLVRKLRDAHPEMELDKDVVDALALRPTEESDAK